MSGTTNEQVERSESRRVLCVAEPSGTTDRVRDALRRRGFAVADAACLRDIKEAEHRWPDAVVLVLPISDVAGRDVIGAIQKIDRHTPVVVLGLDASLPSAGIVFDAGAAEHIEDATSDPAEMLAAIGVLMGSRRGDRHLQYIRRRESSDADWSLLVGDSPPIRKVLDLLAKVTLRTSRSNAPTIFLGGETGTGKGFLARCVHYNGPRRTRPFVEINCATLPSALIESELFGHERGSFTDAKGSRPGLFETGEGGTVFLDEIGAISPDMQAKLLTVIEEKRVRRIGGRASMTVDVQVIAATHENIAARVRSGAFREDLYHRLNVVSVTVPPLRSRGRDVVQLGCAFLDRICRDYGLPPRRLDPDAVEWMLSYEWPGNVRELRNQIERVVLLETDDVVRREHFLPATITSDRSSVRVSADPAGGLRVTLPPGGIPLEELEKEVIRQALERCDSNVSKTARFLSITRQTLIYRMKKYDLGDEESPLK